MQSSEPQWESSSSLVFTEPPLVFPREVQAKYPNYKSEWIPFGKTKNGDQRYRVMYGPYQHTGVEFVKNKKKMVSRDPTHDEKGERLTWDPLAVLYD